MLCSARKINISQILKIFNGSCSTENFVGYDQLIMMYMTKSALFLLRGILFFRKFLYGGPPSNDVWHRTEQDTSRAKAKTIVSTKVKNR